MKRIPEHNFTSVKDHTLDDDEVPEDYKDVYYIDDPTGEISLAVLLRCGFEAAGFTIRMVEKPSKYHDVWLIKAVGVSARQFPTQAEFHAEVIQILASAAIDLPKKDVTIQRQGKRILVCFIWPPTAKKRATRRGGLTNDHDRP